MKFLSKLFVPFIDILYQFITNQICICCAYCKFCDSRSIMHTCLQIWESPSIWNKFCKMQQTNTSIANVILNLNFQINCLKAFFKNFQSIHAQCSPSFTPNWPLICFFMPTLMLSIESQKIITKHKNSTWDFREGAKHNYFSTMNCPT